MSRDYHLWYYEGKPLRTVFESRNEYQRVRRHLHNHHIPSGDVTDLVKKLRALGRSTYWHTVEEFSNYVWHGINLREVLPGRKFEQLVVFMRNHPGFSLDEYVTKQSLKGYLLTKTDYWYKGKPLIRQLPFLEYLSVKRRMKHRHWTVERSVETLAEERGWEYDPKKESFRVPFHVVNRNGRDRI